MEAIDRLYQFAKYQGLSIYKLSKEIGVSNGYLSKQKESSGSLSSKIIEKIVSVYPQLNLNWLLTGDGEMLVQKQGTNQASPKYFTDADIIKDVDDRMKYGENDIPALRLKILELEAKLDMLSQFNEKLLDRLGERSGN